MQLKYQPVATEFGGASTGGIIGGMVDDNIAGGRSAPGMIAGLERREPSRTDAALWCLSEVGAY